MTTQHPASTNQIDLKFVGPDDLTITRHRGGRGWRYTTNVGKRIDDPHQIERLNKIAFPPAYREAWFCPHPDGHIQAIGLDAKGRRQYRYHPDFRAAQDGEKFARCAAFGTALPKVRKAVAAHLGGHPTDRITVIAAVVRLLDTGLLRVGSEVYAKDNKSFGATTLRNRHATVKGRDLKLQYRGKSGVMRSVSLNDRSLSRVVKRCQDLPGQHLFQYVNDGDVRVVTSGDVNSYIQGAMGEAFTAKDFRTWAGSVIAFEALHEANRSKSVPTVKQIINQVSEALGNTPAVARKSYIHPAVLDAIGTPRLELTCPRSTIWMSSTERGFLRFLDGSAPGSQFN